MSVLIIEDDSGVRETLAELLSDEGYRVEVAASGSTAMSLLRDHPAERPSLILLDLMMSDMDGIEFRRRQLADPQLARIPIIVMSARPDVGEQAEQLGALDYLAKPMSFETLIRLVQDRAITLELTPIQ
jgi:CheY-like chemotaxis protein